jgi:hypothetical protein
MEPTEAQEILATCGGVAICTPFIAHQHPVWTKVFESIRKPARFYLSSTVRLVIDRARIVITDLSYTAQDVEWFFYLDDDVMPLDEWCIARLLKHNKPIVSGLYFNRHYPFAPQMYEAATEPGNEGKYWPIFDWEKGKTLKVDVVGGGFLLVKREVIEKLKWHPEVWNPRGGTWAEGAMRKLYSAAATLRHERPWGEAADKMDELIDSLMLRPGGRLFHWSLTSDKGEDFFFSEKCRAAGFAMYCDTGVKAFHMGEMMVTEEHWDQVRPTVHKHDPGLMVGGDNLERMGQHALEEVG